MKGEFEAHPRCSYWLSSITQLSTQSQTPIKALVVTGQQWRAQLESDSQRDSGCSFVEICSILRTADTPVFRHLHSVKLQLSLRRETALDVKLTESAANRMVSVPANVH